MNTTLSARIDELIDGVLVGNRRAVSRLITLVENDSEMREEVARRIFYKTGNAYIIGITGLPGSGKSTLTGKLAKQMLAKGLRVGIVAVDPSSPFSGGAILGDRIRMNDLALEKDVYIRSMGTRGRLGGLSDAVEITVAIFDACRCDCIIIETVGVGQSEVDIAETADTTLVISVPGLGDDIQMIKAGILEIGDILVVNKADRDGAVQVVTMLETMQMLDEIHTDWKPPILMTTAETGDGVPELLEAIFQHRIWREESGAKVSLRMQRLRKELIGLLCRSFYRQLQERFHFEQELDGLLNEMLSRRQNPYDWVRDTVNSCIQKIKKGEEK